MVCCDVWSAAALLQLTSSVFSSCGFLGSGAGASSVRFIAPVLGCDDIFDENGESDKKEAQRH